jgi:hypothetical protein
MITHGAAADAAMMARYYPTLHRVYSDYRGSVWSARATPLEAAAGATPRDDP